MYKKVFNMGIVVKLKNIKNALKTTKEVLKYGGINNININTIEYEKILLGKKILITGAGSGIGFAIAKKCVELGASVIITGRNEKKLEEALFKLNSNNATYVVWDVSDISVLEDKLNYCRRIFDGDIDILVNNAGVQPSEFFPDVTEEEWDKVYDVNSKGTFFLSEYVCKNWMKKDNVGYYRKILNIDSQGGFVGATYPYRMTKWDIRGFTKGLGIKMAPMKILVNGIAPGVVRTEMQAFSLEQGDNTFCNQNLLNRVALPEEIAELAAFMLSDACNFMVGQTVLLDGGYSLK